MVSDKKERGGLGQWLCGKKEGQGMEGIGKGDGVGKSTLDEKSLRNTVHNVENGAQRSGRGSHRNRKWDGWSSCRGRNQRGMGCYHMEDRKSWGR